MAKLFKTTISVAVAGGALLASRGAYAASGTTAFNVTNTANATQNTQNVSFSVNAGATIKLSTNSAAGCNLSGVSGSGDTYIRLVGPSGEVSSDDDSCSDLQSYLTYVAPTAGTYTFKVGCYSSGSCSGTAAWQVTGGIHGVVFIHGTGDYNGTFACTGSGAGTACSVPAALSSYWTQGEVDSVRGGRAYAVVGFRGGTCAPWPSGTTTGLGANGGTSVTDPYGVAGTCGNAAGQGNGDVIAQQINQFLQTSGADDIVIVTHSGGSNQARFILQNYSRNSDYTAVKNATQRVITIAAPTLGTYLANEAFAGVVTSWLAGIAGYGGEGVNFIRTDHMATYNATNSYFGGFNNPVGGANFYATGGISANTCVGASLWGVCIGVKVNTIAGSIGGATCDSAVMDAGLQVLHSGFLNANDSSTARNNCSDGFISCMSAQKLGNVFAMSQSQDHNQSRRRCHGLDGQIASYVNGSPTNDGTAFGDMDYASVAPISQADSCHFSMVSHQIVDSSGMVHGYGQGCSPAMLGNHRCDWDCVALYGHDSTPTWDSTGTIVTSWGATDDCMQSGVDANGNPASANTPWTDNYAFTTTSGATATTKFDGMTHLRDGSSTVWYTDPYWNTSYSVAASCPTSWINDGTCDECALALYGGDGNDCIPGKIAACDGVLAAADPATSGTYTPIYNAQDPNVSGNPYLGWYPRGAPGGMAATPNNGYCEDTECGASNWSPGTSLCRMCTGDSDCGGSVGSCVSGACTGDCASGSSCLAGGCVVTTSPANTDCTAVVSGTSLCR
jgi:hypothetical protein